MIVFMHIWHIAISHTLRYNMFALVPPSFWVRCPIMPSPLSANKGGPPLFKAFVKSRTRTAHDPKVAASVLAGKQPERKEDKKYLIKKTLVLRDEGKKHNGTTSILRDAGCEPHGSTTSPGGLRGSFQDSRRRTWGLCGPTGLSWNCSLLVPWCVHARFAHSFENLPWRWLAACSSVSGG